MDKLKKSHAKKITIKITLKFTLYTTKCVKARTKLVNKSTFKI